MIAVGGASSFNTWAEVVCFDDDHMATLLHLPDDR